jgi:carbonic anhydrase
MHKLVQGVRRFQADVFPRNREMFEQLAGKPQNPLALFVTCSDSRINPNLITQTEPGELFILRNAGNIVPPYGVARGGEGATLEYAVSVLGLKNIIVCGHWHCGAMKSLLRPADTRGMPAVAEWFTHAEATRRIVKEKEGALPPGELQTLAAQQNVLVQIDNLRTHPCVAAGLSRGDLRVFGWVYKIETGEVFAYDAARGGFFSLTEEALPVPVPSPLAALQPS